MKESDIPAAADLLALMAANVERLRALAAPGHEQPKDLATLQAVAAVRRLGPGDDSLAALLSHAYLARIGALDGKRAELADERDQLGQALSILAEMGALYHLHAAQLQIEAATAQMATPFHPEPRTPSAN